MVKQVDAGQMKEMLESFLKLFNEYASHIYGDPASTFSEKFRKLNPVMLPQFSDVKVQELRSQLQRIEPQVTHFLLTV